MTRKLLSVLVGLALLLPIHCSHGWFLRNNPLGHYDALGNKTDEEIRNDLNEAWLTHGLLGLLGATPAALRDFMNPFDPTSPATVGGRKFNNQMLPQALANLDMMDMPLTVKNLIKANIGFGLAGNNLNPLNLGVDLYHTGQTIHQIGFAATGRGIVNGIAKQPAMFIGGLPVMVFAGRALPELPFSLPKVRVTLVEPSEDLGTTPLIESLPNVADDTLVHFAPEGYPVIEPGAGGQVFAFLYGDIKELTPRQIESIIGSLSNGGVKGGAKVMHLLDANPEDAIQTLGATVPDFPEYIFEKPIPVTGGFIVQ